MGEFPLKKSFYERNMSLFQGEREIEDRQAD